MWLYIIWHAMLSNIMDKEERKNFSPIWQQTPSITMKNCASYVSTCKQTKFGWFFTPNTQFTLSIYNGLSWQHMHAQFRFRNCKFGRARLSIHTHTHTHSSLLSIFRNLSNKMRAITCIYMIYFIPHKIRFHCPRNNIGRVDNGHYVWSTRVSIDSTPHWNWWTRLYLKLMFGVKCSVRENSIGMPKTLNWSVWA